MPDVVREKMLVRRSVISDRKKTDECDWDKDIKLVDISSSSP